MPAILYHPAATRRAAKSLSSARPPRAIDKLGAVKGQRAYRFGVLAVGTAYGADITDIIRFDYRIEGVDAAAKMFYPAVIDVVYRWNAPGTTGDSLPLYAPPRRRG